MGNFHKPILKFTLFCLLTLHCKSFAQINSKRFEKELHYNGNFSFLGKLVETKDSGFCIGASNSTLDFAYITLTRLNKYGNLLWSKNFSVVTDSTNALNTFINTKDNGFLVSGGFARPRYPTGATVDSIGLIKLDSAGNFIWAKKYTPRNGNIINICELSDSTIAVALGYYVGPTWYSILQKLDKNGNILWSKYVYGIGDLKEKKNKNLIIFSPIPGGGVYLKEFDANGNDIWEKSYVNISYYMNAWKMDLSSQNESVIISDLMDSLGSSIKGLYVLKTDTSGNVIFSNLYSGTWFSCQTYSGQFTKDCGIVVNARLTYQQPSGFMDKQGILNLDRFGNVNWLKAYTYPQSLTAQWTINTNDYGFASIANISYGGLRYSRIVKTDVNGKVPCNNDSMVIPIKTNIPLTINNTPHNFAFTTIANKNINLISQADTVNIVTLCVDSQFVNINSPALIVNSGGICKGDSIALSVSGGTTYSWAPTVGLNNSSGSNVTAHPTVTTNYTVTDNTPTTCPLTGISTINVFPLPTISVNSGHICQGQSLTFTATGAANYTWSPSTSLNTNFGAVVSASPTATTNYFITGSDTNNCTSTSSANVGVSNVAPNILVLAQNGIAPFQVNLNDQSPSSYFYNLNFGDTTGNFNQFVHQHTYNYPGNYTLNIVVTDSFGCTDTLNYDFLVLKNCDTPPRIPNVFSPNGDGVNDNFYVENECLKSLRLSIFNRWGEEVYTITSPEQKWNGNLKEKKCTEGTYYYILESTNINGGVYKTKGFLELVN